MSALAARTRHISRAARKCMDVAANMSRYGRSGKAPNHLIKSPSDVDLDYNVVVAMIYKPIVIVSVAMYEQASGKRSPVLHAAFVSERRNERSEEQD